MLRFFVAIAVAVVGACDRDDPGRSLERTTIRVSAPFGLMRLEPGPRLGGSSAAALDLAFDPIHRHAQTERVTDKSVVFRRLPTAPALEELLARFRVEGMLSIEQIDAERFRVEMDTAADARGLAEYRFGGFAGREFTPDPWSEGETIQRLRSDDGRVIELVAMPIQDQWRRLLARDIDVVPYNVPSQRHFYEGLDSVRLVDVPTDKALTLVFNPERVPDVAERRHISSVIDRSAIALVCAGSRELRSRELEVEPSDSLAAAPGRILHVGFLHSDQEAVDAARVLRLQLERAGYSVVPVPSSIAELHEVSVDLLIAPFSQGADRASRMVVMGSLFNYQSDRLNEAVERGDFDRAAAILADDVPMVPLFHRWLFAAVDARLCGGSPTNSTSWEWLADLHPCEDVR